MARIEHIALFVDDLDALGAFYVRAFGAQVGPRYVNASKGFESCFLTFESGARIVIELVEPYDRKPRGDGPRHRWVRKPAGR